MKYSCHRCGYETPFKGNLRQHLSRKKTCPAIHMEIEPIILLQQVDEQDRVWHCSCGRRYSHQSGLYRHKAICGKGKETTPTGSTLTLEEKIDHMQKIIDSLLTKQSKSTITVNNNYNKCNVIAINALDTTQIDLDLPKLVDSLKSTQSAAQTVVNVVKYHHFNNQRPEDMNIYISNRKDNLGRYFDGEDWAVHNGDDLVRKVFDKYRDFVDEMLEDLMVGSEDSVSTRYRKESMAERFSHYITFWAKRTSRMCFEERAQNELKYLFYSKADAVRKMHGLKY